MEDSRILVVSLHSIEEMLRKLDKKVESEWELGYITGKEDILEQLLNLHSTHVVEMNQGR
jgi:hypothetical protein